LRSEVFFGLTETLQLTVHNLLLFEPFLTLHCELLLFILQVVLKLKDLFAQFLHRFGQLANLILILLLGLITTIDSLDLLLLDLLDQLPFLLILSIGLLGQVLYLLEVECLLFVVFGFAGFLHPGDVLLFFEAGVHAVC